MTKKILNNKITWIIFAVVIIVIFFVPWSKGVENPQKIDGNDVSHIAVVSGDTISDSVILAISDKDKDKDKKDKDKDKKDKKDKNVIGGGPDAGVACSAHLGCRDPHAINYEYFSHHTPELCEYEDGVLEKRPSYNLLTDRLTKQDEKGNHVRQLQFILNYYSADPMLAVDGIFGPKTFAAVLEFQRERCDVIDGVVGPKTIEQFN